MREGGDVSEVLFSVIMQDDGREVCRMVYNFSCSAKVGIHIPQLDCWFMHSILYITRMGLSCGLIFNMQVVSIMLYADNAISCSQFQIPLVRLFISKINSVSHLKIRV